MTLITFEQAAEILLDGGKITFEAGDNNHPEANTYRFEILDFETLCEEYKLLRINYYDIQLFKF